MPAFDAMADEPATPRTGWRDRLRRAFAVDPPGAVPPDPQDLPRVEALLQRIVDRGMAGPALLFLESWRPLGSLTGQGMHALTPFVGAVFDGAAWERLSAFMERRGSIPWMIERLDAMSAAPPRDTAPTDARARGGARGA
ncbi:MAG: hypothetical protein RLZZ558_1720 [Planctomycetota bacterium]|jgi:hypothetical protein